MIWWHRVGQKVVCINQDQFDDHFPDAPKSLEIGKIYTIAAVILCLNVRGETVVGFDILESPNEEWSEDPRHFRPVRDTSIESLKALLNPTPEQKRAVFQEMVEEKQRETAR